MMPETSRPTKRLLELSYHPGVGAVALRKAVALAQQLGSSVLDDPRIADRLLRTPSGSSAKKDVSPAILERCAIDSIEILSPFDAAFPKALRYIEDFPPIIFAKGNTTVLNLIGCAVVGTREASRLGLSWARQIAEVISGRGLSVVSGLALGIDTAAHEGALRAGARTVAVLAHGLDIVTPSSNRSLAAEIVARGGALLSEHPPGVPPRRPEYVRRNRIQSGMSMCSIVVESGVEGGAIHQGNFTTKQGRRLYAVVPPSDLDGSSEFKFGGAERLMREAGARPLSTREQLIALIDSGALQADFSKLAGSTEPRRLM